MNLKIFFLTSCCFIGINLSAQTEENPQSVAKDSVVINPVEESVFIDKLDKMMNLWYIKQNEAKTQSISSLSDNGEIPEDADSLIALRLSRLETVIPITLNQQTKNFIELYVYKRARSASYILASAQYYFPRMQQIFDKYNVPEELIYLTIIESALNPTAVSRAGATGIWQFMYNTGKMYGLEVNTFIDDRRDPIKATEAAALHLQDLYQMFGDWTMAIAAYNCGAGNVRKAISRSGNQTGFWNIYPYLPAETRGYFPAYCGAFFMMKYYESYGITPAALTLPLDVDTVMVDKELHFEQLAEVLEINLQEIKSLNPQYKRDVIPAYINSYPLTLRSQDIIRYLDLKDSIHAYNYEQYFTPLVVYEKLLKGSDFSSDTNYTKKYHTVKRGETLSKIAVKYGLSIKELQKMNLMTTNYIDVGKRLVVGYEHKNSVQNSNVSENKSTTTSSQKPSSQTSSTNVTQYKIKNGDSLYSIAQKHGVSVEKIMKDNNITNPKALQIDKVLKIIK